MSAGEGFGRKTRSFTAEISQSLIGMGCRTNSRCDLSLTAWDCKILRFAYRDLGDDGGSDVVSPPRACGPSDCFDQQVRHAHVSVGYVVLEVPDSQMMSRLI
jgi:hypothetical protein